MPSLQRLLFLLVLGALLLTPACAPTQTPPLAVTPVESALAENNPTAIPSPVIPESYGVTFTTPDGATLNGLLYGSGSTAVIFSVMGNCKPGWDEFAQLVAAQGLLTLTYQWRGCRSNGSVDETQIQKFVDDLRGAVAFMREQGATKIILAGASLGGCASAKLAAEIKADGLIVIASPSEIPQWGFKVDAADIDTDIPKLFITAENDTTVSSTFTRELFSLAAQPKEWQTYSGTAHGTDLFDGEHSEALTQRLLQFILDIVNEEQ